MRKWRPAHAFFGTYHILAGADTMRPSYGLSLNLHLFFVYGSSDDSGKSTDLHKFDCAFMCHAVISTKIKYAGFTLNQAKLDML